MPQPESYGTPSWDKESSGHVGDVVSSQNPRDVVEVAKTLAAHGGGEASFDLALDLVLNEVVERARLATGATGAAIALARAGEMVCRATTGADAPDLGVRLETKSGLSGACLLTGVIQHCKDTETDPRVDPEACRRLGVRSILVLPLCEGPDPFGLMEVFSSRPHAFGDQDENSLQVLAARVVETKRGIEEAAATGAKSNHSADDQLEAQTNEVDNASQPERIWELGAEAPLDAPAEHGFRRGTDVWTSILGVIVILAALLLGLLVGWRGAIVRGLRGTPQARAGAASNTRANRGTESVAEHAPGNAPPADSVASASSSGSSASVPTASVAKTPGAGAPLEPPSGGLLVTQNGKVIYRLQPDGQRAAPSTRTPAKESGEVSEKRLIHRVEPEYPPEARAQHIQGSVVLDVQIGGDGAVRNIAVVEGDRSLADAAVQAVRQWRYQPFSVNGQPAEMQTRITIRFTLPPT